MREIEIGEIFVPADIERPHGHGFSLHPLKDLPVEMVLLLFRREVVPEKKRKFGPVEADLFGTVCQSPRDLIHDAQVRPDGNPSPPLRNRPLPRRLEIMCLMRPLFLQFLFVNANQLFLRIQNDEARCPIHDHAVAVADRFGEGRKAQNRRDAKRFGEDGDVGGGPSRR